MVSSWVTVNGAEADEAWSPVLPAKDAVSVETARRRTGGEGRESREVN
jgi:hypothetical protein